MIQRYSERKLAIFCIVSVAISTGVYMVAGSVSLSSGKQIYGYLPTFAVGKFTADNQHDQLSYFAFVITTLVEGVFFVLMLNWIRLIKAEFAMLSELQIFAAIWIFFNDTALFIVI